jgi:hypothetical protein
MKNNIVAEFFEQYFSFATMRNVYADFIPKEMMASAVDDEGWFTWKPIDGTFKLSDYQQLEERFHVHFPLSFINFHQRYFF